MDAIPFYLQDPNLRADIGGVGNLMQMQAAQMPPTQAAVNQAVLQQAPSTRMPAQIPVPQNKAVPALQKYLPEGQGVDPNTYKALAQKAMNDQSGSLAGLQKYIDQIAAKPSGIDYSPLAALIDAQTGSHLTGVAEKMAPLTQDEKDKQLFDLRNQLAQGQAKLSSDQLRAYKEDQQIRQFEAHQNELERHNRASETNQGGRQDAMMARVNVQKDNQTAAAVDKIANDGQLKSYVPRIQGADRILGQLQEVKAGKIVDTRQFLNDLNTEYVNLLTGANNSALGKQERTEYTTYAADLSALKQKIEADPQSIRSPKILAQLENSVKSLQTTYHKNYDDRAGMLNRNYKYNPEATQAQADQIQRQKAQYGTQAQAFAQKGPKPGDVEDGHKFKGGNPADPNNWEAVK